MPHAFFSDSFNDIHELKCGQAEEKLEVGGDEKLIFNFIWPYGCKQLLGHIQFNTKLIKMHIFRKTNVPTRVHKTGHNSS